MSQIYFSVITLNLLLSPMFLHSLFLQGEFTIFFRRSFLVHLHQLDFHRHGSVSMRLIWFKTRFYIKTCICASSLNCCCHMMRPTQPLFFFVHLMLTGLPVPGQNVATLIFKGLLIFRRAEQFELFSISGSTHISFILCHGEKSESIATFSCYLTSCSSSLLFVLIEELS